MSDYEDDFEDGNNDTFNDRSKHGTIKKPAQEKSKPKPSHGATAKDSSYDNTLARDKTLGIKPKEYAKKPSIKDTYATPGVQKSKPSILPGAGSKKKGLSKHGGIHSSTPNLQKNRRNSKKSLLTGGDSHMNTQRKLHNFGLTKKAQQTIIPSKAMMVEQAEKLMEDAKNKIDEFKNQQDKGSGSLDETLELSMKENRYLQDTLMGMNDIINKLFEKFDPVKAPMKSYPQTDRIKSPPKSAQMRYRTKEVENAQHALDNMMVEYEKLSQRMDVVKDPNYFSNLHLELTNMNKQMKDLELENKALQTEQKKREIEMEKLLSQGAPDTMFQIHELQNKVTITKDQLRKEQTESEEVDQLMEQVEEQEKALREKEEKLRAIGAKYEVNFDTTVDETKKQVSAELQSKRDTYEKHLGIAEAATKVMRKKLKTMSKTNKGKLRELEKQKEEYEKELELKTQQVKEKNQEISELMSKNSDLQKVRKKEMNEFLDNDKNVNGYDVVEKAIQEQDEKERRAAILIQSWCRVVLAKARVNIMRKNLENEKKQQIKNPDKTIKEQQIIKEMNDDKKKEEQKEVNRRRSKPFDKPEKVSKPNQEEMSNKRIRKDETQPLPLKVPKDQQKLDSIAKNPVKEATFITKKESFEKPMALDTPNDQQKQEQQRESLKKVTSKPQFGKKKLTSKPF